MSDLGPYPEHVPTAADVRGLALTLAVELHKGVWPPDSEVDRRDARVLRTADRFAYWLTTGTTSMNAGIVTFPPPSEPADSAAPSCGYIPRPADLPERLHWHTCAGEHTHEAPWAAHSGYREPWHKCDQEGCNAVFATHHQPSGYVSPSGKMLCACGHPICNRPRMEPFRG